MKAMILSAGFGTRLLPLTNEIPKALVPYKNKPMINYQIEKLKKSGVDEIIVNAHHHYEKITDYFLKNNFEIKINVIHEKEILGTGGGILNAGKFLINEDFFLVINVDIDTKLDIPGIINFHNSCKPFATLAIQKRKSKKYLEFNAQKNLVGRENENSNPADLFAFNGFHILSSRIFKKGFEIKFCDILSLYFDAINNRNNEYEFIKGYDTGSVSFKDIGKLENLNS